MIANKDSLGNILTKEQIEYFKNTKVTNDKNELIVCYHGSPNAGFRVFNPQNSKSQFGNYKFGNANVNYFTTDKSSASSYTLFKYDDGTVYEVYLDIENPYIVDNKSEAEIKSFLNIKDDRIRERELRLFDNIFNKWKGQIIDYSDYRFKELNKDLRKLNLELRPSEDQYDEDDDPEDIDLFDLWYLGKNSTFGSPYIIKYQYYTDELFDDDMYEELRDEIVGEDPKDYLFTTDDIVRYVLVMNEEDGTNYDGIIVKDIFDSTSMFSNIATDYITLKSSNQIKAITNKTPTYDENIDETLTESVSYYIDDTHLLWKGDNYTQEPKNGFIRLYHQTDKKNIQSIIKNGLQGKFKRDFDNPNDDVIWASNRQPEEWSDWKYGDCVVEFDIPKDFDFRPVNSVDYHIYEDVPPKYINAIYLRTNFRKAIMKDFQNTLDIDKSIDRFMQGLLTEHLFIDYNSMFQSSKDRKLNESEILDDIDYDLELDDNVENNEYDDYLDNPNEFDLEKEQRNQIDSVRARNKGKTYHIPTDIKDLLTKDNYRYGWLDTFEFRVVDLEKIIKENGLDNPNHGMFSRRMDRWGDNPDLYYYDTNKEDWLYSPIRLNASGRIIDGNHRLWALYNNGYKYAEVLVPKGALTEAYLTEASRNDLINKSKKGKAYKDQSRGKNRWERKKWSSVASTTREYNSIDMNAFFKKDILTINIPVQGETNKYNVRIRFSGALREIQNAVKRNNNKLDYKSISQALIRTFNGENVYVYCNCPDFVYRMNWYSKQNGFDAAKPREQAPYQNRFAWTNRYDDMGGICKHVALVISNTFWLMKVASVINNYIHYAEQFMQRQFAELIFPKIYGIKYPQAVQLGLFDRKYLKHSKGVIDEINNYGKNRTKFKKEPKPQQTEPEFAVHPKQLSIFDDEIKQNSTPYKKQTIFDMGVEDVEDEVTTKPTFKKAKSSQPVMNKGFKQLSIFDEEEEN